MMRRRRERAIRYRLASMGGQATVEQVAHALDRSVRRVSADMERMAANGRGIHLIRKG